MWVEKAIFKYQIDILNKSTLAQLLKKVRLNKRLMVCLEKDLPYKEEYPFILLKKAKAMLLYKISVRNMTHINSRFTLILAFDNIAKQLKKYEKILAQIFDTSRAEHHEKQVKYLV